jgi:hypothetical protein
MIHLVRWVPRAHYRLGARSIGSVRAQGVCGQFKELAEHYSKKSVTFVIIDCALLPEAAAAASVSRHPTFRVFHRVRTALAEALTPSHNLTCTFCCAVYVLAGFTMWESDLHD